MSLSTDLPLALVLGGTHPHVALIRNLRKRGYRVLLVDYLESPPAKEVANEHLHISTLAMDEVLELARDRRPALVISTCVDRANVTAAYVSEKLGLPAPYSFDTAMRIADKQRMKENLARLGIPTAPFRLASRLEDIGRLEVSFPVVVKPVDTGGSKAVRVVHDASELHSAAVEAFRVTAAPHILIEDFLYGDEVSADCVVQDGTPHVLNLRKRHIWRGSIEEVTSVYASTCPVQISPVARSRINDIIGDIARGFGLHTTPLLVQLMVNGDDPRVIELAPRIGGAVNFRSVLLWTGVDIVDVSIDACLGQPFVIAPRGSEDFLCSSFIYTRAGSFGEIRGANTLVEEGVVSEIYVHKSHGATIGPTMASRDCVASLIVRAASEAELLAKVREAIRRLDVVDVQGRSIMRRDVYLKSL